MTKENKRRFLCKVSNSCEWYCCWCLPYDIYYWVTLWVEITQLIPQDFCGMLFEEHMRPMCSAVKHSSRSHRRNLSTRGWELAECLLCRQQVWWGDFWLFWYLFCLSVGLQADNLISCILGKGLRDLKFPSVFLKEKESVVSNTCPSSTSSELLYDSWCTFDLLAFPAKLWYFLNCCFTKSPHGKEAKWPPRKV